MTGHYEHNRNRREYAKARATGQSLDLLPVMSADFDSLRTAVKRGDPAVAAKVAAEFADFIRDKLADLDYSWLAD